MHKLIFTVTTGLFGQHQCKISICRPPAVRVDRFEEAITVIKGLMADGPVSFQGRHYTISGHEGLPKPIQRPHPPIAIGGGGRRVLSIAAREADIVGINANLKEGLGGAETAPDLTPARTTWPCWSGCLVRKSLRRPRGQS